MDFNSILISALIGAVSIGGAVGIGELLKKALPERLNQMITVGAIVVGLVVMRLANGWHADYRVQSQVDAVLADSELFKVIKSEFPEEYAAALAKIKHTYTKEDGERLGVELMSGIRTKYAQNVRASSIDRLRKWNDIDVDLTKSVLELRGWERCNKYLAEGVSAIHGSHAKFNSSINEMALMAIRSLADGKDDSQRRSAATDEDWGAFFEYWRTQGATAQDIERVTNFDQSNEETCGSFISYLGAASSFEGDAADRILTEFAFLRTES